VAADRITHPDVPRFDTPGIADDPAEIRCKNLLNTRLYRIFLPHHPFRWTAF